MNEKWRPNFHAPWRQGIRQQATPSDRRQRRSRTPRQRRTGAGKTAFRPPSIETVTPSRVCLAAPKDFGRIATSFDRLAEDRAEKSAIQRIKPLLTLKLHHHIPFMRSSTLMDGPDVYALELADYPVAANCDPFRRRKGL